MGIISTIGRKSFKVQSLVWTIVILLFLGAITMVYPFLLMISGSSKSGVDVAENNVIPGYLKNDEIFYSKAMESFFNEDIASLLRTYSEAPDSFSDVNASSFKSVRMPKTINHEFVDEWVAFLNEKKYPHHYYTVAHMRVVASKKTMQSTLRKFKQEVRQEYNGDLDALNKAMETEFQDWTGFEVVMPQVLARTRMPSEDKLSQRLRLFLEKQPHEQRYYSCPEGFFKVDYLKNQYTRDIAEYNAKHNTKYNSWEEVALTEFYPAGKEYTDLERKDWEFFTRNLLNVLWIKVSPAALNDDHKYLEARHGTIAELNKVYESNYKSFADVPLVEEVPGAGARLTDWIGFIQGWNHPLTKKEYKADVKYLSITGPEYDFRNYLKEKYKTVENINKKFGTNFTSFASIAPPQEQLHARYIMNNAGALKWEFSIRNFIAIWEYIVLQGRAMFNTLFYCILSILASLIVNPIAAYALSRFRPPSTYKVLLFLMLTMAFPPMVTQIPNFLMLREFGLLNTYAALILPGLANGYSIFLLKGFFDSLPQELYESAMIDGASECRIFLQITMSLSTPILAVIALGAFNGAYGNFMMALLICQDKEMWTLMPYLYQLQQFSGQGIIFASLLIAAIPTFLVFAFCQNIIMRGIVVPVEK